MYKSTDSTPGNPQYSAEIDPQILDEGNGVQSGENASGDRSAADKSLEPNPTLMGEELIGMATAAEILGVSYRMALSYCNEGISGVTLEHVRRKHRIFTSREAIRRFGRQKRVITDRLPARYRSPEENRKRSQVRREMARDVMARLGFGSRE